MISGKKILVVDDEIGLCDIYAEDFSLSGAEVFKAYSGNEALKLLDQTSVDLILSDIKMSNGSGIELLKQLKSKNQNNPLIFLITGYSNYSVQEAYNFGAEAIFPKPCDFEDIVNKAESFFLNNEKRLLNETQEIKAQFIEEITVEDFKTAQNLHAINISRGGMFIATEQYFPKVGENIAFKIQFKNLPKDLQLFSGFGVCRWHRKEKTNEDLKLGYGIEFTKLNKNSIETLNLLLKQTSTLAFIPIN